MTNMEITIFGAGITGLSTAYTLLHLARPHDHHDDVAEPRRYRITIVARDLPDGGSGSGSGSGSTKNDDQDASILGSGWASPHACAAWVALGGGAQCCPPRDRAMQLDALEVLRGLAAADAGAGVRRGVVRDLGVSVPAAVAVPVGDEDGGQESEREEGKRDGGEGGWNGDGLEFWRRVPGLRKVAVDRAEQGEGTVEGVEYESVVVNPGVFLPWLRARLEEAGVQFKRVGTVKSLEEIRRMGLGHDVLINASGAASMVLEDVRDRELVVDRTYTVLVKSEYDGMYVRRGGGQYTYVFGRGDGTAVVGGISEPVDCPVRGSQEVREELIARAHRELPEAFPSGNPCDYVVVEDMMGIRPLRPVGVRAEKEIINGHVVIHAYGTTVGGYIYSFGLAKEIARSVDEHGLGK